MSKRISWHLALPVAMALMMPSLSESPGLRSTASTATATATASKAWAVPRTPWGDPDLQGLWPSIDMQGTPYKRPKEFGTRSQLTDAEFAARQARAGRRRPKPTASGPLAPRTTPGGTGPPSHWGERGNPQRQASLVVDPLDGRLPPMTEEGRKRIEKARSTYFLDFPNDVVSHPFETFEDFGPYDRCISRGALASMLPTGYNMGTEILQIPGYVIIRIEMIHETRIVPLDGRPHVSQNIRSWMGDPRGRWEGDTLVIETTNFNGKVGLTRNGNTLLTSPDLRLVERLTRVDANTIQYEATVEDPKTWTRTWKVALPFTQHPEYRFLLVHVPRGQLRDEEHPQRRAGRREEDT